ncbi:MAG: type II secretion system protein GspE, partial [bacterium (Candidatus Ratteibacteria) CG01_land_8_20_14_3_00_40_19]
MNEKAQLKIGEILINRNLITEGELQKALSLQRKGELLGQTLVRLDILNEADLVEALSEQLKISFVKLNYFSLDKELMKIIPESLAREHQVIPLKIEGTILTLATADPLNIFVLDHISQITGYIVEPVIASPSEIKKTINQYYGLKEKETEKVAIESAGIEDVTAETPTIKLVD